MYNRARVYLSLRARSAKVLESLWDNLCFITQSLVLSGGTFRLLSESLHGHVVDSVGLLRDNLCSLWCNGLIKLYNSSSHCRWVLCTFVLVYMWTFHSLIYHFTWQRQCDLKRWAKVIEDIKYGDKPRKTGTLLYAKDYLLTLGAITSHSTMSGTMVTVFQEDVFVRKYSLSLRTRRFAVFKGTSKT